MYYIIHWAGRAKYGILQGRVNNLSCIAGRPSLVQYLNAVRPLEESFWRVGWWAVILFTVQRHLFLL